jgi:hypothetical protein
MMCRDVLIKYGGALAEVGAGKAKWLSGRPTHGWLAGRPTHATTSMRSAHTSVAPTLHSRQVSPGTDSSKGRPTIGLGQLAVL